MILSNLCDDILNYISTLINIKCHVCYKKFDYKNNFYITIFTLQYLLYHSFYIM